MNNLKIGDLVTDSNAYAGRCYYIITDVNNDLVRPETIYRGRSEIVAPPYKLESCVQEKLRHLTLEEHLIYLKAKQAYKDKI